MNVRIRILPRLPRSWSGRSALLGALLLSGCAMTDPFQRPGVWRPEGINQANIAAMVAHPGNLRHGQSDGDTSDSPLAAAAVTRLWHGQPQASAGAAVSASPVAPSPSANPSPLAGSPGGSAAPSGSP